MKSTGWKQIQNFLKDEEGATGVEYGVMIALIIAICVGIVVGIGQNLKASYQTVEMRLRPE